MYSLATKKNYCLAAGNCDIVLTRHLTTYESLKCINCFHVFLQTFQNLNYKYSPEVRITTVF